MNRVDQSYILALKRHFSHPIFAIKGNFRLDKTLQQFRASQNIRWRIWSKHATGKIYCYAILKFVHRPYFHARTHDSVRGTLFRVMDIRLRDVSTKRQKLVGRSVNEI